MKFYSEKLDKLFESEKELKAAETAAEKEALDKKKASETKKADAKIVEDAFKALNAARKSYKEDLTQLTKEYAESLENLRKAFELGKKDIHNTLAVAEESWDKALKEFTAKYPAGYHLTLHDGDFETTISKQTSENTPVKKPVDLFDLFFGW